MPLFARNPRVKLRLLLLAPGIVALVIAVSGASGRSIAPSAAMGWRNLW
jgi:hypothetical protein